MSNALVTTRAGTGWIGRALRSPNLVIGLILTLLFVGLALVSRIAVAHGGGAWIADRPGGGARVGFTVQAT